MKKLSEILAIAGALAIPLIGSAFAGEVKIEALNKAREKWFVYTPDLFRVQPGDSVVFVSTDKVERRPRR